MVGGTDGQVADSGYRLGDRRTSPGHCGQLRGQVPTLLDNRDRRALDDARERSKWGIAR